jgi:hypothetical protein
MGLKGYRLWVMRQLDSTCSAPPLLSLFRFLSLLLFFPSFSLRSFLQRRRLNLKGTF